jgi:hypothetical protein
MRLAVRIRGVNVGDLTGFNLASAGDFDADGDDDLLIAAPDASPQFDSDGDGMLDSPGIDVDRDGAPDIVTTHDGRSVDTANDLNGAGVVYVVYASNRITDVAYHPNNPDGDGVVSLRRIGLAELQGVMFVGRKAGDHLGGGIDDKRQSPGNGVGPAGDVNGDGAGDILIGSILADPDLKKNAGEAYLILGQPNPLE